MFNVKNIIKKIDIKNKLLKIIADVEKNIIKIGIKKIFLSIWCCGLIILAFYIFLVLKWEREREWQNIHQYIFRDGKYVLANEKEKENNIRKPNILAIEFSSLGVTHGEVLIEGSLSVSFYDHNKFFNIKPTKQNSKKIRLEIAFPNERYGYNPMVVDISCTREYDRSGAFYSGFTETVFIPKGGHLFDYPLDNLIFSIIISSEPKIRFDLIDFYNRVSGILLKDPPSITFKDSKIVVDFETSRKDSIRLVYLIISSSLILYIILILFFVKKMTTLISAVGGFFISVWSIRSLFSEATLIFPNVLDLTVIFASIILLVGILTRILFGKDIKER
jgi:hypothetical protein